MRRRSAPSSTAPREPETGVGNDDADSGDDRPREGPEPEAIEARARASRSVPAAQLPGWFVQCLKSGFADQPARARARGWTVVEVDGVHALPWPIPQLARRSCCESPVPFRLRRSVPTSDRATSADLVGAGGIDVVRAVVPPPLRAALVVAL